MWIDYLLVACVATCVVLGVDTVIVLFRWIFGPLSFPLAGEFIISHHEIVVSPFYGPSSEEALLKRFYERLKQAGVPEYFNSSIWIWRTTNLEKCSYEYKWEIRTKGGNNGKCN